MPSAPDTLPALLAGLAERHARVVAVPSFPTTKCPNGEKAQRASLREGAAALLHAAETPSGASVG